MIFYFLPYVFQIIRNEYLLPLQLGKQCKTKTNHFSSPFFFFIEVQLIYNVVLVSSVQQSDSVIRTYICVYVCVYI